jgi:hypothetical protein
MPAPPPRRSRTGLIVGVVISVVVVLAACVGVAGVYLAQQGTGNPVGTGSATATASGTVTPGATVVYQDALTSDNGGWAVDPPRCQYADGGYEITGNYICYAPAGVISDATITVEAKQTQGITTRAFGIVLRRASQGNYYEFNVDSNSKWIFFKVVGNSVTSIVDFTENAAIKGGLNSVNVLAVQAAGSHFDFFVNGTHVGQADDSTFASGRAGLAANTDIQAIFNNFKVTKP